MNNNNVHYLTGGNYGFYQEVDNEYYGVLEFGKISDSDSFNGPTTKLIIFNTSSIDVIIEQLSILKGKMLSYDKN